jgi:hypothetical protein
MAILSNNSIVIKSYLWEKKLTKGIKESEIAHIQI